MINFARVNFIIHKDMQAEDDLFTLEEEETSYPYPVQEVLNFEDQPTCADWALVPLYKTTMEGRDSNWQVGFCEEEARLWIKHGLDISEPQVKTREIKTNNSGRSLQEQALLEARNRYRKMYYKGYYTAKGEVCVHEPMLANKYNPGKNVKLFPVAVQAKLDGVRALMTCLGEEVRILSRTGREWPHLTHIREEVKLFFQYLPPGCVLDGEIYSTELSFDELSGLMRTTKGDRSKEDKLSYYIFDLIDPFDSYFEVRHKILSDAFTSFEFEARGRGFLQLMPVFLAGSHDSIVEAHDEWVSEGMEGCMIRRLSYVEKDKTLSLYKPRRCNNLLKYKSFDDEEVTIVEVGQGAGTEEGLAVFTVEDKQGNRFEVRPRGDFAQRKIWFEKPEQVLGQAYTIRFFGKTAKGIPRFPVGVGLRNYE
nr:ATP-dependent DNA ligase [Cedratvirus plubellavi]